MARMTPAALEISVLGMGHLAAAVRRQLRRLGAAPDARGASEARRLVLACSDYACTSSFADANRRALASRTPILFAWISAGRVALGPLVVPLESPCFECQPCQEWDFSLNDEFAGARCKCVSHAPRPTLNPDTLLESLAHFGAALVARELIRLRLDAPDARLIGRVAKFDPPCIHPEVRTLTWAKECRACGGPTRTPTSGSGPPYGHGMLGGKTPCRP